MNLRRISAYSKFFLMAAVLLAVLSVGLIWFSGRIIENAFVERIRSTVVVLVKNEARKNLTPEDFKISDRDRARSIFQPVVQSLKTLEIAKIKIWNPQLQIIYSDDEELVGKMFAGNEALRRALVGETIVEIEEEETEEGGVGGRGERFLEIYVPINYPGQTEASGVIEAYYDLAVVKAQAATTQRILVYTILGFTGVTFLLLWLFFNEIVYRPTKRLDELKNKFLTVMSHQMRTPLSAINWNLELLLAKETGTLTGGQADLVRVAYSANKEVIGRIDDLLRALEIEEGKLHLEKEALQIESILAAAMSEQKKAMEVKQIEGELKIADEVPKIMADRTLVREVLNKLLENAVVYTPEGGRVSAEVVKSEGGVRVEVTDSGIGIPKAEQDEIFERFERASNAFKMKTDSSGLGLYVAKQIIIAHGGKIGFESEEGKGSKFWVELPAGT